MKDSSFNTSRRTFITQLVLASIASGIPLSVLQSCSKKAETLYKGTGKVPFKVWEELLMALSSSPDFHAARAEKLIASKDPEAMFNYVRDAIVLVPSTFRFRYEGRTIKHGIKGVLRTGMATAREKAELLSYMYNKAGFSSHLVTEKTDFKPDDILKCYVRKYNNNDFNPAVSTSQIKQWQKELQADKDAVNLNNEIDSEAEKLAEKLLSHISIDEKLVAENQSIEWSNNGTPSVKFNYQDKELYAHLIDPTVPFGELRSKGASTRKINRKPTKVVEKLKLSLVGYHSNDVSSPIQILNSEWNLIDVLGKQINISFLKDLELGQLSTTSIHQIQYFTPSFALQGVDDEAKFLQENSYVGDPIMLNGESITLDENNPNNYKAKLKYDKPVEVKNVTQIECKAKAFNFPRVRLEVFAKDSNGNLAEGLQPNNFQIKEDGQQVAFLMKENRVSPKILVLSDASLSMPAIYRGKGMEEFNANLENAIKEEFPYAKITFWKTGSNLYTYLLKASQENVDLILYCTDGHVYDKLDSKNIPIYKAGAPAFILDVMENDSPAFTEMAELTNGKVIPAKDQETTRQAIFDYVKQLQPAPCIIEFNSRSRAKHEVEVALTDTSLSGKSSYEFPERNDNESGLISLQLKISLDGYSIKKTLAGANASQISSLVYNHKLESTNKNFRNQVRGFLMGGAQLYVESEGPTLATALSDVLKAQLSKRAWGEAFLDNNIELAAKNFKKGSHTISGNLLSLLTQPRNAVTDKSITYAKNFRLALSKTIWPIEDEAGSNAFDYFQSSQYKTLSKEGVVDAFKKNTAITAQLALRENSLYKSSTFNNLLESKLISNQYLFNGAEKELRKQITELAYQKNTPKGLLYNSAEYSVFDRELKKLSYWKINKKTGELYGMLPDGTGGGSTPIPIDPTLEDGASILLNIVAILEKIVHIASAGSAAMFANPLAGVSLAVVAKYGVTLAKLYGIVSQTLVVMDTTGMDDRIKKELQVLACEVYKEVVFAMFGNAGATFAGLEQLISLMSPDTKSPFSCT